MTDNVKCTWTQDCDGFWETACGEAFDFVDGTPAENGMRFCCYCGKPLKQVPYVPEPPDA